MLCMTHVPRLYTASEVADKLGVSAETVRRWARDGRVDVVILPSGVMRFRQETVDTLTGAVITP